MMWLNKWSSKINNLQQHFFVLIQEGTTPSKLAITVLLGISIGLIPIPGISTILLFLIALIFRLNQVIIQCSNYLVYPLQLILLTPFYKVGGVLFSAPVSLSVDKLKQGNWWEKIQVMSELGIYVRNAVAIWMMFVVLFIVFSYPIFLNMVKNLKRFKNSY